MARFSGAAVLLILVATVSVYTCAILGGAALGRTTLERTAKQQPADSLRVSVSVRGVAESFAKELWGGDREGGGDNAGDGAARASPVLRGTPQATTVDDKRFVVADPSDESDTKDDVHGIVGPRHTNFSGEITRALNSARGVIKVGPWGGPGGQPFYTRGTSVPQLWSITLYHSDAIHALSYDYLQTGFLRTHGPFGGHSSGSTGVRATINLDMDEHITTVEGTFGHCRSVPQVVITSLTFHTNMGRTYGPYGNKAGTPFSIPAKNGCIVGFWGRSGWLLDAIGVYITPNPVYKAAS